MKELPTPTLHLASLTPPLPGAARRLLHPLPQDGAAAGGLRVAWARHLDDVRQAQRLRYRVFVEEMGARVTSPVPGHDVDLFDDYCEHLLVREEGSGEVVGTYRVLTPAQARRVGCFYSDTEFDLTRLRAWREQMVELGRSCVHPQHRHGGVIMALWAALADFMVRNKLHLMIGCASIPMGYGGAHAMSGGGHAAASIWRQVRERHLASVEFHVQPRVPLPVDALDDGSVVEPPALVKGYLRLGAKVLGPPAWDPEFNTADLPMMMRLDDMPPRYRRHLLGERC
ncbi:GNAT family N-acetyltransferase [Tepidimonas charontis]|uniref:L-ornithine N(alpha)-acyltransferase n=1 Tax=Tepidimonas charontis TaxID=2267262 RepID=A0A554XGU0_9BURK|nr:GNAT family N-acyltransferase [Tepidimonas charontis]TSE35046.1 N-acyl amino acid synthase, PEP-CTERM/exosortase system-associated [Tepidimonas charontis]